MTRHVPFARAIALVLAMMLALSSVIAVSATHLQGQGESQAQQQQDQQGEQVSLRELLRNTDQFVGEDVTVTGDVGQELTRVAFTLTRGNQEILVIGDRQTIPRNPQGEVTVSGAVEESFQISEVEDQLGIRLNEEALSTFEGQPFIMADQVRDAQQDQDLQAEDDQAQQDQTQQQDQAQQDQQQQGQAQQAQIVTLRELLRNTDQYFDDFVSVSGPVGRDLTNYAFTLTRGNQEILVIGGDALIPNNLPDEIQVDGLVERSLNISDLETALEVNIDEDVLQEFEGEPYIMASRIRGPEGTILGGAQQVVEQVRLREVIRNTDRYVGDRVQVTGQLEQTPVPHVYELSTGNLQIVLLANPQDVPDDVQGEVVVIGTVHQFTVDELIQAIDIEVPRVARNLLQDFGPIGAIAADQVMTGDEAQAGDQDQVSPVSVVNVADIVENPGEFTGGDVTIRARRGQELGRGAFTVRQGGEEIIVVGNRQVIPRNVPRQVEVTGQVQEDFNVQEVEEQTGLPLDDEQAADFEGTPFIIAEDVRNAQETPRQPETDTQQDTQQGD